MIHRKFTMFNQTIGVFEFDPKVNLSQLVKSTTGKRIPISKFTHPWYEQRGYRMAFRANLGFFSLDSDAYMHLGLLARDSGYIEGAPWVGYEMWMDQSGNFFVDKLNKVGVKGIGTNYRWASSLAYPLVKDGKKFLDTSISNFGRYATRRVAYGVRQDGIMIVIWAENLDDSQTADVMLHLKCVKAISGDGGGSVQTVIDGVNGATSTRALSTIFTVMALPDQKVQFIDETTQLNQPTTFPPIKKKIDVEYDGKIVSSGYLIDNKTHLSALDLSAIFGFNVVGAGDKIIITKK